MLIMIILCLMQKLIHHAVIVKKKKLLFTFKTYRNILYILLIYKSESGHAYLNERTDS